MIRVTDSLNYSQSSILGSPSLTKARRKTNLWHFDPSILQPLPKAGILERRLLAPARVLGKHALYAVAIAYPLAIVTLGIMFGGLVFWTTFAGSMGLIWLVITKTGYANNFASWDVSNRKFLGLLGAFCISVGLFYGLFYLRVWIFPVSLGGLGLFFVLALWRHSKSSV